MKEEGYEIHRRNVRQFSRNEYSLCHYNLKSSLPPPKKKYSTELYWIKHYPLRYQTKREGKSVTEAKGRQEQVVIWILLSLSMWRKHWCRNIRENEVLKKNPIQSQEETSPSRSPQYRRTHDLACIFLQLYKAYESCPGANSLSPTLRMLLILPWWMLTNYCFMPNPIFSTIVLPLLHFQ